MAKTTKKKHSEGNPFFACRVPADLLRKFRAKCKAKKTDPGASIRAHMAKVAAS